VWKHLRSPLVDVSLVTDGKYAIDTLLYECLEAIASVKISAF
jgi:hypothetical protein